MFGEIMDLFQAVEKRASVRSYKDVTISEDDLRRILNAGIRAPTAGNVQPWVFIVTRKTSIKKDLAEAANHQDFIESASTIITVCAVEKDSASRYGIRGSTLYCLQDTAAAVENILLAATALGYGTCWIGAFDEEAVRDVLNVPETARPVAIIPLGLPKGTPASSPRKPLEEVVHHEFYGGHASSR